MLGAPMLGAPMLGAPMLGQQVCDGYLETAFECQPQIRYSPSLIVSEE
jgi:hypothetical protein